MRTDGLSRASLVSLVKSSSTPVDEIYGLIHLVTGDSKNDHVLASKDTSKPVDMLVYATGNEDLSWSQTRDLLDEFSPIVVFSKSYCPFSKKAETLLTSYDLTPSPKIIQVDLRDDMHQVKLILMRLTRHATFPNIMIRGKSIGGSDDLFKLHENKALRKMFEDAGVRVGAAV